MSVESASYINQLVGSNPTASDPVSEGDNHLRLIKQCLKNNFPNIDANPINPTTSEINFLVGVTSAIQAQLNALVAADTAIGNDKVNKAGDTMTGPLFYSASPSGATELVNKAYADLRLPLAGGTMTGQIIQPLAPGADSDLANKKYVNDNTYSNPMSFVEADIKTVGPNDTGYGVWLTLSSSLTVYNPVTHVPVGYEILLQCLAGINGYATNDIIRPCFYSSGLNSGGSPMIQPDGTGKLFLAANERPRYFDKQVNPSVATTVRNSVSANWAYKIIVQLRAL